MIGMRGALGVAALVAVLATGCGPKTPPISELGTTELWERGIAAYNAEDWEEAIRYFDRFALTGGTDPRTYQARLYVAQARFERKEYITAAGDFSRLAADLGQAGAAAEARFMACRSYEELSPKPQLDQEYTRAAIEHCSALVEFFPASDYTARANAIVDRMVSKLAQKVFETGDWYQGRRAYDSAILYYEEVVAQYPATQWAPRALRRMVEVYGILEWEDERDETRERLLREYPESEAARAVAGG